MPTAPRPSRLLAPLAVVLALGLGVAACSSDGGSDGPTELGPSATLDGSTTAPSTTTTTASPATTPTTAAPPALVGVATGEEAARKLYDAWVADDRATAATIAEPEAIAAIFAAPKGPYELYRGCDTGEFTTGGCLFRDRSTNHTIQVDLEKQPSGWVVIGAFYAES